jgi:putative transposase
MKLQRNTHHVYRLMYHFVWIPKYRHKVFVEPYPEAMKAIIHKIGYDYDFDIQELKIPEDHIHMVVKGEPKTTPSHVMQVIKSISAREFFKLYPEIRKRYFWGVSFGHRAISSKP